MTQLHPTPHARGARIRARLAAGRRAGLHLAVACLLPLALTACSEDEEPGGTGSGATPGETSSAAAEGTVPEGWITVEQDGISIGVPADFEQVDNPGSTVSYGIPYADQAFPPPKVDLFVETDQVGSLDVRLPLVVGNIENELDITVEDPQDVEVAGASAAVQFSYEYTTAGGTSVTGVELEPTPMRQTDLLIDRPGLPKYGLRYAAPADQYDEALWDDVVASVTVGDPAAG